MARYGVFAAFSSNSREKPGLRRRGAVTFSWWRHAATLPAVPSAWLTQNSRTLSIHYGMLGMPFATPQATAKLRSWPCQAHIPLRLSPDLWLLGFALRSAIACREDAPDKAQALHEPTETDRRSDRRSTSSRGYRLLENYVSGQNMSVSVQIPDSILVQLLFFAEDCHAAV